MSIPRWLSNLGTAAVFAIFFIYSIATAQFIAAASYVLYAGIWIYLTCLTVDGEADFLTDREAFFDALQGLSINDLPANQRDCSICYGVPERMVQLPCGHLFGRQCVARIFPTDKSDFRCPFCRRALFSMLAPWDRVVAKLYVCVAVVNPIERLAIAGFALYRFDASTLTCWNVLDVVSFCWNLYTELRRLRRLWENMDRNELMVWEIFTS